MAIQDPYEITKEELSHLIRSFEIEGAKAKFNSLDVTFEVEGFEMTLHSEVRETSLRVCYTDAEGNEYLPSEVKVEISFPGLSSATPEVLGGRLQLANQVVHFGKVILDHFKGRQLLSLCTTAEAKAAKQAWKLRQQVWDVCEPNTKGMRIDQMKTLHRPEYLQDGDYTFELKDKSFHVRVTAEKIQLIRTQ